MYKCSNQTSLNVQPIRYLYNLDTFRITAHSSSTRGFFLGAASLSSRARFNGVSFSPSWSSKTISKTRLSSSSSSSSRRDRFVFSFFFARSLPFTPLLDLFLDLVFLSGRTLGGDGTKGSPVLTAYSSSMILVGDVSYTDPVMYEYRLPFREFYVLRDVFRSL